MNTKIIIAALSGLALLSACDNAENSSSDVKTATQSAPVNTAVNTNKAVTTPEKTPIASETENVDQDFDGVTNTQDDNFDEEASHHEEENEGEMDVDDQMMEEDAPEDVSPEVSPPIKAHNAK